MNLENQSPLFSIIIPSYNYGHYLPQSIASVLAQSGTDFEIVIVDDGSTDNTNHIVNEIIAHNKSIKIHYIHQKNQGVSAARNCGAKNAVGQYLLFLDADDQLLPDALEHFRNALERDPKVDCLFGGAQIYNPNGKIKHIHSSLSDDPVINTTRFLRRQLKIFVCCLLIRRSIFEQHQFPETLRKYEDLVLLTHIFALYRCQTIEQSVFIIHKHDDSLRHQLITSLPKPEEICHLIFDQHRLPPAIMNLRNETIARLNLANFHELYRTKQYQQAKPYYFQAIRAYPLAACKWQYLKRFIVACLK